MDSAKSFGEWLRQRRKALDLTQEELARRVGCSTITLRKLEAEERRPSKQIAERLAELLQVLPAEHEAFLRFARGNPFAAPAKPSPQAAPSPRPNLPISWTRFIGRETELAEIQRRLATKRQVTLTGPGGVGKTRLAVEAARGLLADYPQGVFLVELASLSDPGLVSATVAAAVGVGEAAGRPLLTVLIEFLQDKKLLLMIDNCEHVIEACARLAERLIQYCPHLHLLATSQEALGIPGESIVRVASLSLPAADEHDLAVLSQSAAVQLFVERAAAALPGFALTAANAPVVGQVCRRLAGTPLALELAAARVDLLQVGQIAARLDDAFQMLTGGSRTAPPRQQAMQAVLDWSYHLLTEGEQALLRRLAVFAGGWTLEAAEAVCAGDGLETAQVVGALTRLVNKSLVVAERRPDRAARFHLFELTRQYASAKLRASGEWDPRQRRHAEYFALRLGAGAELRGPSTAFWIAMTPEIDNARAALTWSLAAPERETQRLQLADPLASVLIRQGLWQEARHWLETVLAQTVHDGAAPELVRLRAFTLFSLGSVAGLLSDFAIARRAVQAGLELCEQLGERPADPLHQLGWLAREMNDLPAARRYMAESLALLRAAGDEMAYAGTAITLAEVLVMEEEAAAAGRLLDECAAVLRPPDNDYALGWIANHRGHVAQLRGDYPAAREQFRLALSLFEPLGPREMGVSQTQFSLGACALAEGQPLAAAAHFEASLRSSEKSGDRMGLAWCLAGLAGVAVLDEEPARAARLWGAAEALRQSLGCRPAPAVRLTHERLMNAAREQLGEDGFAGAWAAGQALTLEQAVALALEAE